MAYTGAGAGALLGQGEGHGDKLLVWSTRAAPSSCRLSCAARSRARKNAVAESQRRWRGETGEEAGMWLVQRCSTSLRQGERVTQRDGEREQAAQPVAEDVALCPPADAGVVGHAALEGEDRHRLVLAQPGDHLAGDGEAGVEGPVLQFGAIGGGEGVASPGGWWRARRASRYRGSDGRGRPSRGR